NEFAATSEWNYKMELPWELLQHDSHLRMKDCVRDLCHLYKNEPALHEKQFSADGFEWIDLDHRPESVIVFRRKGRNPEDDIVVILNMTPVVRWNWRIRLRGKKVWNEIFNSDARKYWGTGEVYNPRPEVFTVDKNEDLIEINMHLPALGGIVLK
ncbi:MAG: alpha amylase C-terminal domain-containing protein, partial [Chitinophagaceae bacterium]|nr:alpha amylase C-terminal domain-containing protein [Chitinophagaceae bacterium]